MKSKILFSLLTGLILVLGACSNPQVASDSLLQSVPKDASMVTTIKAGDILQKADFESVKNMAFYQEIIREAKQSNATLGNVLADPSTSGIDLNSDIVIAHQLNPDNPEEVFVGIVAAIKDKSALEALINTNEDLKHSSENGFSLATKGSQSVAWNDNMVVLGMTNAYNDPVASMSKFFGTTTETSIAGDANLKKAISGNHDITSWVSSNALAGNPMLKDALTTAGINKDAAKDNFIHSYVDFNNGTIESRSDLYLQDALMADINMLFKDKVKTDFSSAIPSNANSAMAVALDFEGLVSMLQKKGFLMMANFGLSQYGLTLEDINSTFGGDILLYSTPGVNETPFGTFATNIRDKEKLSKFLDLGIQYNVLTKVNDELYTVNNTSILSGQGFGGDDAQLMITDDMVYVSADRSIIEKLKNGGFSGSEQLASDKIKRLKGNIFSGFSDMDNLMANSDKKALAAKLMFKDLNFTTNRKNGTFNMNFKDENSNALKQLFQSINELYLAEKKDEI